LEPVLPGLAGRLIFDFAGTGFIDSMGLSVLVRAHSRLRHSSSLGSVVVRSMNDQARGVLRVTGLDQLLDVES
jgi:anti-anti-sigma factor